MILTRSTCASLAGTFLFIGLLPLLVPGSPPAMAASAWRAELSAGGGYDDDVLGRPGENSTFPILATGYWSLAPSVWGVWAPGRWSLSGGWNSVWNAYESDEAGAYLDNYGRAGLAFRAAPRLQFRLDGEAEWFHRTEFQDYDFNRLEIAPALIWQVSNEWSLQGSWSAGRIEYPERTTLAAGETQVDEPEELELAIGFDPNERWRLEAEAAHLDVDSNSRQYEHSGDRLSFGVSGDLGRGWTLGGEMAWEQRDYDRFLYAIQLPSGAVRPGVGREDDSISLLLDLSRRINGNARIYAGVAYLDYGSSLDDYAFDRLRISAGVSASIGKSSAATGGTWDPATLGGAGAARNPLSPVVGEEGVTFHCRAPGATSVHLVGSMNDWSTVANPLSGPTPDGTWVATIQLEPGLYRYMFLVDATDWRSPDGAQLYEDDGFGQRNGVLEVAAPVTSGDDDRPTGVTNPR